MGMKLKAVYLGHSRFVVHKSEFDIIASNKSSKKSVDIFLISP